MNNFNKIYESIFKPASKEEVETRKEQANLEEFKEWVENDLEIKYEDLFKPENINKKSEWGTTALIRASYKRYKDIVKILLDHNANVNVKDKYGETALKRASRYGYKEVVDLLKQYGAKE